MGLAGWSVAGKADEPARRRPRAEVDRPDEGMGAGRGETAWKAASREREGVGGWGWVRRVALSGSGVPKSGLGLVRAEWGGERVADIECGAGAGAELEDVEASNGSRSAAW